MKRRIEMGRRRNGKKGEIGEVVIIILFVLFLLAAAPAIYSFAKKVLFGEKQPCGNEVRQGFDFMADQVMALYNSNSPAGIMESLPFITTFPHSTKSSEYCFYAVAAFNSGSQGIAVDIKSFGKDADRLGYPSGHQDMLQRPKSCTGTCLCLYESRMRSVSGYSSVDSKFNTLASRYDTIKPYCRSLPPEIYFYSLAKASYPITARGSSLGSGMFSPSSGNQGETETGFDVYPLLPAIGMQPDIFIPKIRDDTSSQLNINKRTLTSYGSVFISDAEPYFSSLSQFISRLYIDKIDSGKFRAKNDNHVYIFLLPGHSPGAPGAASPDFQQEQYYRSREKLLSLFDKKDASTVSAWITGASDSLGRFMLFIDYIKYATNPMLFSEDEAAENMARLGPDALASVSRSIRLRIDFCKKQLTGTQECLKEYGSCQGISGANSEQLDYCKRTIQLNDSNFLSMASANGGFYAKVFSIATETVNSPIDYFRFPFMSAFLPKFAEMRTSQGKVKLLLDITEPLEGKSRYADAYKEYLKFALENKDRAYTSSGEVNIALAFPDLAFLDRALWLKSEKNMQITHKPINGVGNIYLFLCQNAKDSYLFVPTLSPSEAYFIVPAEAVNVDGINSAADIESIIGPRVYFSSINSMGTDERDMIYLGLQLAETLIANGCVKQLGKSDMLNFVENTDTLCGDEA